MDAIQAVLTRRSIRQYTDEPVSDQQIDTLLRAGFAAPNTHHEGGLHLMVIKDREFLNSVQEVHPHSTMLTQAPVALCVCLDLEKEKFPDAGGYWIQDGSAATENILIAANAQGLGACWLGIHPRQHRKDFLREKLNLPEHVEPFCLIALGHPAETKEPSDRYNTACVHHDRW